MQTIKLLLLIYAIIPVAVFAQSNFSISPQHPKPGDLITISYEPAGAIAGTMKPVEGSYYMLGHQSLGFKNLAADDLVMKREGKKYITTIQTDTASNFVYFGFSSNKLFDNNNNEGYYLVLQDGEKPRRGAHYAQFVLYQYLGRSIGVESNPEKALAALEKEMALYPEDRKNYLINYIRLKNSSKPDEAPKLIQKEIETVLKNGLKAEDDYQLLEQLYASAKLPEQAKLITNLKKEKFPKGKWLANESMSKLYMEKDPEKKAILAAELREKIKTDPDYKHLEGNEDYISRMLLLAFLEKKDWAGLKAALPKINFTSNDTKASIYNSMAWEIQKSGGDLVLAEELSRFATEWTKKEMSGPSGKKPTHVTTSQWKKSRQNMYAQHADTYAMVLYRQGNYKKGLTYARDASTILEGKDADINNSYALLAEKTMPAKKFKQELEQMVKNGAATGETKQILERLYIKEKGSAQGYEDYMAALEKEPYLKLMEEIRKSMINETSPSFALMDLDGNNVSISELKGKVVVVDFWATWCGPCKASFPGMQRMVNKYRNNPNVRFLFVDTWEKGDDKKKLAADFINANKYTFQVLMDNEDKVVSMFKVEGIPTKFVIDPKGMIRFKSVGYSGNDEKLVTELTAMIDLASQPAEEKKAF